MKINECCIKDVDLEAMPTSIFLNDDDHDDEILIICYNNTVI